MRWPNSPGDGLQSRSDRCWSLGRITVVGVEGDMSQRHPEGLAGGLETMVKARSTLFDTVPEMCKVENDHRVVDVR